MLGVLCGESTPFQQLLTLPCLPLSLRSTSYDTYIKPMINLLHILKPPIRLVVRRDEVLLDSFAVFQRIPFNMLRDRGLRIQYVVSLSSLSSLCRLCRLCRLFVMG